MKKTLVAILAAATLLVVPASALATTGADGAGHAFGDHHATMGQTGTLNGTMNPGMHDGFSGWMAM